MKKLRIIVIGLSALLLVLAGISGATASWQDNCKCSLPERKAAFEVWFESFLNQDPGKGKLLDPKKCDIVVNCTEHKAGTTANFSAKCGVLFYKPKSPEHMKPMAGESFAFQTKVLIDKNSIATLLE